MKKELAWWSEHQDKITQEGISISLYAKRHHIPVNRLYYWLSKILEATKPAPLNTPNVFVALKVAKPAPAQISCALILSGGMRLELSALATVSLRILQLLSMKRNLTNLKAS